MPAKFYKQMPNGLWLGLWEISETENELIDLSGKALLPDNFFSIKSELQRKQSICGRLLIKELSLKVNPTFEGIYKNEHGKPLLKNLDGHISISHSKHFVTASLHTKNATGVDIEKISPRMRKVLPRICSKEELLLITDDKLGTFFWCAKEAMYKLYGQSGVHFAEQLEVKKEDGLYFGFIKDDKIEIKVKLASIEIEDFVMVWAVSI